MNSKISNVLLFIIFYDIVPIYFSKVCPPLAKIQDIGDINLIKNETMHLDINDYFKGSLINAVLVNNDSLKVENDFGYQLLKHHDSCEIASIINMDSTFYLPINGSDVYLFSFTSRHRNVCVSYIEMNNNLSDFSFSCPTSLVNDDKIPYADDSFKCFSHFYFTNYSELDYKRLFIGHFCTTINNSQFMFYRLSSNYQNKTIQLIIYNNTLNSHYVTSSSITASIPNLNILAIANKNDNKDLCYSEIYLFNLNFSYLSMGYFPDPFIHINGKNLNISNFCFNNFEIDYSNNELTLIISHPSNEVIFLQYDLNTFVLNQKYFLYSIPEGTIYKNSKDTIYIASYNNSLNQISRLRIAEDSIYFSYSIQRECELIPLATMISFVKTKDFFAILMNYQESVNDSYFIRVFYENNKGIATHVFDLPLEIAGWIDLRAFDNSEFNIIIVNSECLIYIYKLTQPSLIIDTRTIANQKLASSKVDFIIQDANSTEILKESFLVNILDNLNPIASDKLQQNFDCFYNISCPINIGKRINGYYQEIIFKNNSEISPNYIIIDQKIGQISLYKWLNEINYEAALMHKEFQVFDDSGTGSPYAYFIADDSSLSSNNYCIFQLDENNNKDCGLKYLETNFSQTTTLKYGNTIFRIFWSYYMDNFVPYLEIFELINNQFIFAKSGYLPNLKIEYYIVDINFAEDLNKIYIIFHNYFLPSDTRSGILIYSTNTILNETENQFIFLKNISFAHTNRPKWMKLMLSFSFLIYENGTIGIIDLDNDDFYQLNEDEKYNVFDIDINIQTNYIIIFTTFPNRALVYNLFSSTSIQFIRELPKEMNAILGSKIVSRSYCAFSGFEFGNFYSILWRAEIREYFLSIYNLEEKGFNSQYLYLHLYEFNDSNIILSIQCLKNGVILFGENNFQIIRIGQTIEGNTSSASSNNNFYSKIKYQGIILKSFQTNISAVARSQFYNDISFNISINMLPSNLTVQCIESRIIPNSNECIGLNLTIDNIRENKLPIPKIFKGYNITYSIINEKTNEYISSISYGLGPIILYDLGKGNQLTQFEIFNSKINFLIEQIRIKKTFIRSFAWNFSYNTASKIGTLNISEYYNDVPIDSKNQKIIYFLQFEVFNSHIILYSTQEAFNSISYNTFYYCILNNNECIQQEIDNISIFYSISDIECQFAGGVFQVLCTLFSDVDTIFLILTISKVCVKNFDIIRINATLTMSQVSIPGFIGNVTDSHISNISLRFYVLVSSYQLFSININKFNQVSVNEIKYLNNLIFKIDTLSSYKACKSFALYNLNETTDRIILVINNNLIFRLTLYYNDLNNSEIETLSVQVLPLNWGDNTCIAVSSEGQFLAILFKHDSELSNYEIKVAKMEADEKMSEGLEILERNFLSNISLSNIKIKSNVIGNKTIIGMITDISVLGYLEVDFTPTFFLNSLIDIESNILKIIGENKIRANNVSYSSYSKNNYLNPFIRMNYGKWMSLIVVIFLFSIIFAEYYCMKTCSDFIDFYLSKDRNSDSRSKEIRDTMSNFSDESIEGTNIILFDYQLNEKRSNIKFQDKKEISHFKYN